MNLEILFSALRLSIPLSYSAWGGYTSERAGIVNIGLEGLMLIGAFAAAAGAYSFGNPWIGLAVGISASILLSALHGLLCIHFKANQIISGIAINFLAAGIPPVLAKAIYDSSGGTPQLNQTSKLPAFFLGSPLLLGTFLLGTLMIYIHRSHLLGQYIRFAGEHPDALESQGVSVMKIQWIGVLLSGFFCGLAGAYLSIDHGSSFSRNMTAGRGFIALAALIIGRHTPWGAWLAALGFGLVEASQILLQSGSLNIPVQWVQMIPYIATLIVLIFALKEKKA